MAAVSSALSFRAIAIARKPASASLQAIPSPNPRLPPVTITLRMVTDELSCLRNRQCRNEIDGGRDLVRGKFLAAEVQDVLPCLPVVSVFVVGLSLQNDIRNYKSTGDGIFPRSNQRHANLWMAVDDRFYFLRMDLKSSDVDDPITPADEIVAIPAKFERIACIHKALRILERAAVFTQVTKRGAL